MPAWHRFPKFEFASMDTTIKVKFAFLLWASNMVSTGLASAQTYPNHPIRCIIP
jgi:hypothetical protein